MTSEPRRPVTFAVDCGGTGIKAVAVDAAGEIVGDRHRVRTRYPSPPKELVVTVCDLAEEVRAQAGGLDRATIGFPGMVRGGVVHSTPHYVTEFGPFTEPRPELVQAWAGHDIRAHLESALGLPTRVLNDAEVAGLAVVSGRGVEVVLTLGTGLGFAMFDDGALFPKIELSQAHVTKKKTYDQHLGHRARKKVGAEQWSGRVQHAIDGLRPVLWWDHLYLGGGGAKHLTTRLSDDVTLITNDSGLLGGPRAWEA